MVEILHADISDKKNILSFIKNNFSSEHILLQNKNLFDHYFCYKKNKISFYIAKIKEKIVGILGYSLLNDYSVSNTNILYLQMWSVLQNLKMPIGIMLLRKIEEDIKCDLIICLGINKKVLPFYKRLGYYTGTSSQWLLDRKVSKNFLNIHFKKYLTEPEINKNSIKNIEYLENKFLNTKFRDYIPITIYENKMPKLALIGRYFFDDYNKKNVFRIVDFTGESDLLGSLFSYKEMRADCIELNLNYPTKNFKLLHFRIVNANNFIRLYNEPPVNEFKEKSFAYKIMKKNNLEFYIVTGDSDQDRPNK